MVLEGQVVLALHIPQAQMTFQEEEEEAVQPTLMVYSVLLL